MSRSGSILRACDAADMPAASPPMTTRRRGMAGGYRPGRTPTVERGRSDGHPGSVPSTGDPLPDDPDDAVALARHAAVLADAIAEHLGPWVAGLVVGRHRQWSGTVTPEVEAAAASAAAAAVAEVVPEVRSLLGSDVDGQRTGPLDLVRRAVRPATEALARAGVPPIVRDAVAERLHPDDVYDLTPGSFAEVHPALHDLGLTWGAAKAHVVLARRRREGRR